MAIAMCIYNCACLCVYVWGERKNKKATRATLNY